MPLALLLSPDDQAVSAITAVLEEMAVQCERPLDGVSAAKQLNSYNFDLVLVDCENLPAAKLIFDVCRRGKSDNNPVPIAIVDGRAGLPTAFRLGAELILTKPVAKDQARSTIRAAVSRVRKDETGRPAQSESPAFSRQFDAMDPGMAAADEYKAELFAQAEAAAQPEISNAPEPRALAAAATSPASSPSNPFADPAPVALPSSSKSFAMPEFEPPAEKKVEPANHAKPKAGENPVAQSDDPVLAEIDRIEASATETDTHPPLFTAIQEKPKHNPFTALVILILAGGGFYAAWMYQPGFRPIVQGQIDRVLTLVGMQHPTQVPPPAPVRTSQQPTATTPTQTSPTPQPGGDATSAPGTAATTAADAGASSNSASQATTLPAATTPTPQQPSSQAPTETKTIAPKSETKVGPKAPPANSEAAGDEKLTSQVAQTTLPGAENAVILSSKGAERRLIHSVQPHVPAGYHSNAQGTMVLKTLIDGNGKVSAVRLVEGDSKLAPTAIAAVKQWRYRPYERDGKTMPFQTVVLIDFQRP